MLILFKNLREVLYESGVRTSPGAGEGNEKCESHCKAISRKTALSAARPPSHARVLSTYYIHGMALGAAEGHPTKRSTLAAAPPELILS